MCRAGWIALACAGCAPSAADAGGDGAVDGTSAAHSGDADGVSAGITTSDSVDGTSSDTGTLACEILELTSNTGPYQCEVGVLDCGSHGHCQYPTMDAEPICSCDDGYVGPSCQQCDAGWVAQGPDCVSVCDAAAISCGFGACNGDPSAPGCICPASAIGDQCDACAPGYVEQPAGPEGGTVCTPDCGSCPTLRECSDSTRPPSCTCAPSYQAVGDNCEYRGAFANPDFDSCEGWELYMNQAGMSEGAVIEIRDGKLHMATVDGQYVSSVEAVTEFRRPLPETIPNAALRARVLATVGTTVCFGQNSFDRPLASTLAVF